MRSFRELSLNLLAFAIFCSAALLATASGAFAGSPSFAINGGNNQSKVIYNNYSSISVVLKDGNGNAVSGQAITFTINSASNGAGGYFQSNGNIATVNTDGSGVATAPSLTAGSVAGAFTITATTTYSVTPSTLTFTETNLVGPAANISAYAGSGTQTAVGTTIPANTFVALVSDKGGNALSSQQVTFSVVANAGATGTFSGSTTVSTDSSGKANAPALTVSNTTGTFSVVATLVSNTSISTTFTVTIAPGALASITVTGGTPQTAGIGQPFGSKLSIHAKDSSGNAIPNTIVTFSAPVNGASGTFSSGLSYGINTDSSGNASSSTFTANNIAGTYQVTASITDQSSNTITTSFTLTNTANAASVIAANAGTPQSATISTAFGTALQALVTDNLGNPVSGVSVTFTAPGSGASGTFANGTATDTETSDANGLATASAFKANATGGTYNVTAAASCCGTATFVLTNASPGAISANSGTPQTATVNTQYSSPLQVLVKDTIGNPLSGATVNFAVNTAAGGAGGILSSPSAPTNSSGIASVTITANTVEGLFNVTATVTGLSTGTATFTLTNLAGSPATVAVNSGSPQSATISTAFGAPLVAIVKDQYGNPVPNAAVNFAAPGSGASGTFANSATVTAATTPAANSSGIATGLATSSTFTANSFAGTNYAVTATVAGTAISTSFTMTNLAAGAATIVPNGVSGGGNQSAQINTTYTSTLQALVKDAGGNPLSGVNVTFTAPASGASGLFGGSASVVVPTGSNGVASTAITANGIAGTFTVSAIAQNASGQASFTLTNTAGLAASIAVNAGSGQSAAIMTAFGTQLTALVTDSGGNPLANQTVIFQAPASGASGVFSGTGTTTATAPTNQQGLATAPAFTANGVAGSYNVTASVSGVTTPASFSLTNATGKPADPTAYAGTPQSTPVLQNFAPLQAQVLDANNNPLSGIVVTFKVIAGASGASGTFGNQTSVTATTINGIATAPTLTANSIAGSFTVLATVVGVAQPATFNLTNTANAQLTITVKATGKDGTFNFTASPALGSTTSFSLTTSSGIKTQSYTGLANGTYTIKLGTLPFGFKLSTASCTPGTQVSGMSVTASLIVANATSACTFAIYFDSNGIKTATQAAIKTFMQNRADAITSSQPRATRGDGRFTGSLFGGSSSDDDSANNPNQTRQRTGFADTPTQSIQTALNNPALTAGNSTTVQRQAAVQNLIGGNSGTASSSVASPLSLSGSTDGMNGNTSSMVSAFVSLSALRTSQAQLDAAKAKDAGLAYNGNYGSGGYAGVSKFDMWAEVQSNSFQSSLGTKQNGFTELAYAGMDYLVHPAILVGVLTQVDWAKETSGATGVGANGVGWMVGPYTAIKLTPQITFDARAAWGQSSNSVNPFGVYTDNFDTDRLLVSGRLTGNWRYGAWRFSPEASIVYFDETQKAYTDQFGVYIPGQTVMLGRATFGPEVGYQIKSSEGSVYEPFAGLKGVYDFSKQDAVAADGSLSAPETFRGKVEAGLSYKTTSGVAVQGAASYDGLGAKGFEDIQGQVSLRVPLY